jgi:hypothetical protein
MQRIISLVFVCVRRLAQRPIVALALCGVMLGIAAIAAAEEPTSAGGDAGQSAPSKQMLAVFKAIQALDQSSVIAVQVWASYPKPEPPEPILTAEDQVEAAIAQLKPPERTAVLSWLDHGGRSKLYALGASDADIGPCVPDVDPKNCAALSATGTAGATVNASSGSSGFRDLTFTVAPGQGDGGGIAIERGFAMVKTDATSETHCLSFKNAGTKKADAVTFVYKLHAQSGEVVYAGSNVRAGSFDPGTEVPGPDGPASLAQLRAGPDKAQLDNCWTKTNTLATPALLRAAYIVVGVASVTFDDGTHWVPGQ